MFIEDITDKSIVSNYILSKFKESINWTTLKVDWGMVSIDITYYLTFSSSRKPWGYYFRLYSTDGNMLLLNPLNRNDLEKILIYLISSHCTTKYGNRVDGRDTLYNFIPKAKKAYKS